MVTSGLDGLLDGHDPSKFSEKAKSTIVLVNYVDVRVAELGKLKFHLETSRKSYLESLKEEILIQKSGIDLYS